MKMKGIGLLVFLCAGITTLLKGQVPIWEWMKYENSNDKEQALDVVADPATGEVYMAGSWKGTLAMINPLPLSPSTDFSSTYGGEDGLVVKFSPDGDLLWAFKIGGPGNDLISAIHLDNQGHFYLTGTVATGIIQFSGTSSSIPDSSYINLSKTDSYLAKYTPDGKLEWYRHSDGNGDARGLGIASRGSGVYVTGAHDGDVAFGGLPSHVSEGNEDIFIVKYSPDGDEKWHIPLSSDKLDVGEDLVCDDMHLFVAGEFTGPVFTLRDSGSAVTDSLVNSGSDKSEIFMASYTLDGNLEWASTVQGSGDDFCRGIDIHENVLYAVGSIGDAADFPDYALNPVPYTDQQDAFAGCFSKVDGATSWVRTFWGENGENQEAFDVSSDISGNLYITGYFDKTLFTQEDSAKAVDHEDVFLLSLSGKGNHRWLKTAGSNQKDYGYGVDASFPGKVFLTGTYENEIAFDSLVAPDGGNTNLFIAGLTLPCIDAVGGLLNVSDSVVCEADSIVLSIQDYVGTIQWQTSPPGLGSWSQMTPDTLDTIHWLPAVSADYRVLVKSASCSSDTSNVVSVQVNPFPSAVISGDVTTCDDGSVEFLQVELSGSPPWDLIIRHNGLTDTAITGILINPYLYGVTQEGSYTVVSVSDVNCIGKVSGNASLTYYPPSTAGLSGDTAVCGPVPVDLHVELTGDGPWDVTYSDGTADSMVSGIATPDYDITEVPFQTTTYTLSTVTDAHGCSSGVSGTALVQVDDIPESDPGSGGTVCGLDYALQATAAGDSGMWIQSGPGTATFIPDVADPQAKVTVSDPGDYDFTWRVFNGSCMWDSSIQVHFMPAPEADPGTGGDVCGLDFALQAIPTADTGFWSLASGPGPATFSPGPSDPNAIVSVSGMGRYEFIWTAITGSCSSDSSVIVNFFDMPVINSLTGGSACGLEYRLNATGNADMAGSWTLLSGPGNVVFLPDERTLDALAVVDAYGTYSFQWTAVNGPCSASGTVDVEFMSPPQVDAGPDASVELGGSVRLQGTSTGTFSWTPATSLDDPTILNPLAAPRTTTTYYLDATGANGCKSLDSVLITVLPPDFADAGPDVSICPGDSIQLHATGGDSYRWETITGPVVTDTAVTATAANGQPVPADQPDPWVKPRVTTTYVVHVTRSDGISDSDTITVTVLPRPFPDAGDPILACAGDPVQLSVSGAGSVRWFPAFLFADPTLRDPTVTPDSTTTFVVRIVDTNGCRNADTVTVSVFQPPLAQAGPDQELLAQFETTLEAVLEAGETGEWSVSSGSGTFEQPDRPGTRVSDLALGENTFSWKVDNGVCPPSADQVTVLVHDFLVPTVITPNGDGKNDRFRVEGIERFPGSELVVLNRWGEEVYRSAPYTNDWNGVNQDGKDLPEDTYYILLKIRGDKVRKSYLMIVR